MEMVRRRNRVKDGVRIVYVIIMRFGVSVRNTTDDGDGAVKTSPPGENEL